MSPPPLADEPQIDAAENPNLWRFTWEAQSHVPNARLILYKPDFNPSTRCRDLKITLRQSQLTASFLETEGGHAETTLRVPVPSILVDPEAPVNFRAFDDHIEVKIVLLLSVDHPLVMDMNSVVGFEGEDGGEIIQLSVDRDLKKLASMNEVHFYCRNCSMKLTKGIRCFEEMPSVNWREVADNWFGNCCCSFGGESEKLVAKYVKSYSCAPGLCFLSNASVLLCMNDLLGCEFPDVKAKESFESDIDTSGDSHLNKISLDESSQQGLASCCENRNEGLLASDKILKSSCGENNKTNDAKPETSESLADDDSLLGSFSALNIEENKDLSIKKGHTGNCLSGLCTRDLFELSSNVQKNKENVSFHDNQTVFMDGYLGTGFMVRSSDLSKSITWVNFSCPNCSCLLGSYPCFNDGVPIDGGVRLFKYSISTCPPSKGSDNAFRDCTLERMFVNQLLENAEDELSFRMIVKDIETKSPKLQIILLNPNSWYCAGRLHPMETPAKLSMYPSIKLLYSTSSRGLKFDLVTLEDWVRKHQADEIYMFSSQIRDLIRDLELGNRLNPPSCGSLNGLFLSNMRR